MAIVTRQVKGSALTHEELDNNFNELEARIEEKANEVHSHGIESITGLQEALDDKIDIGDVNEANGLLRLNAEAKVPTEFLPATFEDVETLQEEMLLKANTEDIIEAGKIKVELLPSVSTLKTVRHLIADGVMNEDDGIVFLSSAVSSFNILTNAFEGKELTIVSSTLGSTATTDLEGIVRLMVGEPSSSFSHSARRMQLVYSDSEWRQIG